MHSLYHQGLVAVLSLRIEPGSGCTERLRSREKRPRGLGAFALPFLTDAPESVNDNESEPVGATIISAETN